ncbi:hypothetical protein PR202_ga16380 [Eleusine coracana subsp. coracana]|uniref:AP2/ERF domain-containing protein n=1 Tax=Eleusine coracana subsp. coracana TaxID=191504 RepID=A0AAV5CN03_ELECO|nr:hypothetical protein QOZ80_6AG0529130 [Eleusine coracana subsp. coracana]GJM99291.1 hypothetical protein PR202_ga16380 [Eleusine coracana subsp. coracana]
MDTPSSSSMGQEEEYMTVWSAPPKKPAGRTKFRETRHPVFRGVRRRGPAGAAGRWVCEVRVPGRRGCRLWLGTFDTAEAAARAHDAAMISVAGAGACLNFADSAWLLPPLMPAPTVMSGAREVRVAVARAVETLLRRRRSAGADHDDEEENVDGSASPPVAPSSPEETTYGVEEEGRGSPAAPPSSVMFEFELDFEDGFRIGGMDDVDSYSYYASLAQGMLVDPPAIAASWEDGECGGVEMALWSY